MTIKMTRRFRWASDILAGISGLLALGAVSKVVPLAYAPWIALGVAATGYAAKWFEQQIPARRKNDE